MGADDESAASSDALPAPGKGRRSRLRRRTWERRALGGTLPGRCSQRADVPDG